jgi:ATP-dependent Clp protease ATP-binding subunit ClpC
MYERFTDRSRRVMLLANEEAKRRASGYVRTDDILVALVKEGHGVAAHVIKYLGFDATRVGEEVEKAADYALEERNTTSPAESLLARKVFDYALKEAKKLGHNYVGTEHLLLGVVRTSEGIAAHILINLGLSLENVRKEVLNLLGHDLG